MSSPAPTPPSKKQRTWNGCIGFTHQSEDKENFLSVDEEGRILESIKANAAIGLERDKNRSEITNQHFRTRRESSADMGAQMDVMAEIRRLQRNDKERAEQVADLQKRDKFKDVQIAALQEEAKINAPAKDAGLAIRTRQLERCKRLQAGEAKTQLEHDGNAAAHGGYIDADQYLVKRDQKSIHPRGYGSVYYHGAILERTA
ncbi:uncharacterized protein LTR77_008401 [Saxophila tyrrhenica]|uniref:Uncharacterized protein n=1 Tax=Saxophila tyrrhenica TaxID=1690608 RepID=A0AAV9P3P3_9PEZI|nr:hypothetical protein LTR77_008401 [Saxophila tyrrhenica]